MKKPFPLGAGANDPAVNFEVLDDDAWWHPMSDEEIDALFGLRKPEPAEPEPACD